MIPFTYTTSTEKLTAKSSNTHNKPINSHMNMNKLFNILRNQLKVQSDDNDVKVID
jgi:hypothetical protein